MLQRTRADLVVPVYDDVMRRFPTAAAFASASPTEIQALLRPLGFTHRNRRLQTTARACRDGVPRTMPELMAVPGVGRYAATATLCFAYGRKLAVLDPTVIRLLGRLGLCTTNRSRPRDDLGMWDAAAALLPSRNARDWNYAVLDLGALVCRPRPRCPECPLLSLCPTGAAMARSRAL